MTPGRPRSDQVLLPFARSAASGDEADLDDQCRSSFERTIAGHGRARACARASDGRSSVKLWRQHHGAAGRLPPAIALPNVPRLYPLDHKEGP